MARTDRHPQFLIYNEPGGIAFRLLVGGKTVLGSVRRYEVVCAAERAIASLIRNSAQVSRLRIERLAGGRAKLHVVARGGQPIATSETLAESAAARLSSSLQEHCEVATIVDTRPNKRAGPGACVIG